MTKAEHRAEFILHVSRLIIACANEGIRVVPFAFFRTAQEQRVLFNMGKSNCDGTTKRSMHQDWLAMDLAILNADGNDFIWAPDAYKRLGELAEECGLVWGGRWSLGDCVHVELKG